MRAATGRATGWVDRYVADLRARAKQVLDYGDERGAKMMELHATEIEARQLAFDSEEISIEAAAEESGYSAERLRTLRREGKWSGRRGDLPRHPHAPAPPVLAETPDGSPGSIADRINEARARGTPRNHGA